MQIAISSSSGRRPPAAGRSRLADRDRAERRARRRRRRRARTSSAELEPSPGRVGGRDGHGRPEAAAVAAHLGILGRGAIALRRPAPRPAPRCGCRARNRSSRGSPKAVTGAATPSTSDLEPARPPRRRWKQVPKQTNSAVPARRQAAGSGDLDQLELGVAPCGARRSRSRARCAGALAGGPIGECRSSAAVGIPAHAMWGEQTSRSVLMTYAERDSIRRVIDGFFETGRRRRGRGRQQQRPGRDPEEVAQDRGARGLRAAAGLRPRDPPRPRRGDRRPGRCSPSPTARSCRRTSSRCSPTAASARRCSAPARRAS